MGEVERIIVSQAARDAVGCVDVVAAAYKFKKDSAPLEGLDFQEWKIGGQAGA